MNGPRMRLCVDGRTMAFIFIFASLLGLNVQAAATAPYRNCFTKDLYDVVHYEQTPTFETTCTKLFLLKRRAIDGKLIRPINDEIAKLKTLRNSREARFGGSVIVSAILGAIFPPSLILSVPTTAYSAYSAVDENNETCKKLVILERQKQQLIDGLIAGAFWQIETIYAFRKINLPKIWQDRIEGLLLAAYHDGTFNAQLLVDLVTFPEVIKAAPENNFVLFLDQAKQRLQSAFPDACVASQDALTSIAEAGSRARSRQSGARCTVYLSGEREQTLPKLRNIAHALNLPSFEITARHDDRLDDAFLFGTAGQDRGLMLKPFLGDDGEKRCRNPVLIITNLENWVNEENLNVLLKLFDPELTTLPCAYFGVPIDVSALCVLACGACAAEDFPEALQDRLLSYHID